MDTWPTLMNRHLESRRNRSSHSVEVLETEKTLQSGALLKHTEFSEPLKLSMQAVEFFV